ncbi:DUF488 domain-containing protein [Nocardia transvalensis]|uniref:DUF488 domain-containing protein n=1 Tax=Nocardia transvalensis TaxID=37333 RepID=UPI001E46A574|nr:DUF488 domain-containing protein [Nocardia transvalensis]MBF6331489.1 DUF488 domain-containing protein [Nocardia transvalensis]
MSPKVSVAQPISTIPATLSTFSGRTGSADSGPAARKAVTKTHRRPAGSESGRAKRTSPFWHALDDVLHQAASTNTAIMCAEARWERCHRRMVADAAMLIRGAQVLHLTHDGELEPHVPRPEARVDGDLLAYDVTRTLARTT